MKYIFLALLLAACSTTPKVDDRHPQSTPEKLVLEQVKIGQLKDAQRMGYYLESDKVPFKGCVIYLEGLGDSIRNHNPLFEKLSEAGYRTLAFDYLGQGGSEGDMAHTRVSASGAPFPRTLDYEIGNQAKFVWQRYSEKDVNGRNCAQSPKRVIGWSTGGLAGYKLAHEKWADAYVLISPGIVPSFCVGESADNCLKLLNSKPTITIETLTRNKFADGNDPHLDPIRPKNIFHEVKEFAVNLTLTSYPARLWKIDRSLKGLVFITGPGDVYVDAKGTAKALAKNAPSFKIISYPKAFHEVDNDLPEVAEDLRNQTVRFFDSN